MDGQWMSNGRTIVKERLTPLISDSKGSADADYKQLFWKGTFCFRAAQLIVKPFSRRENLLITHRKPIVLSESLHCSYILD